MNWLEKEDTIRFKSCSALSTVCVEANILAALLGGKMKLKGGFLIPLFSALLLIMFYPVLMLWIGIHMGGSIVWIIYAVMLSPYVILWYFVIRKRISNYLKLLLNNKPFLWNLEKSLEEYQKLIQKGEKS